MNVVDGFRSLSGGGLMSRAPDELIGGDDGCIQTVPELHRLAMSVVAFSNKLEAAGREALFFGAQNTDPRLRLSRLASALSRRHRLEAGGFSPDAEFFAGAKPPSRGSFQSAKLHEDEWLDPEAGS